LNAIVEACISLLFDVPPTWHNDFKVSQKETKMKKFECNCISLLFDVAPSW